MTPILSRRFEGTFLYHNTDRYNPAKTPSKFLCYEKTKYCIQVINIINLFHTSRGK